jgi:hypothetical protein
MCEKVTRTLDLSQVLDATIVWNVVVMAHALSLDAIGEPFD